MSYITCYNGERVSLVSGAPTMHSAGVALGRITRFCGHLAEFYPVLAHTLTVGGLLPDSIRIHGLLHDVPEAMMSDVPTPMKTEVARNREERILARVYASLGLDWPVDEEIQELIHDADQKALFAEAIILGHNHDWGDQFDPMAGSLTRKHRKLTLKMLEADYAGPMFERRIAKALAANE